MKNVNRKNFVSYLLCAIMTIALVASQFVVSVSAASDKYTDNGVTTAQAVLYKQAKVDKKNVAFKDIKAYSKFKLDPSYKNYYFIKAKYTDPKTKKTYKGYIEKNISMSLSKGRLISAAWNDIIYNSRNPIKNGSVAKEFPRHVVLTVYDNWQNEYNYALRRERTNPSSEYVGEIAVSFVQDGKTKYGFIDNTEGDFLLNSSFDPQKPYKVKKKTTVKSTATDNFWYTSRNTALYQYDSKTKKFTKTKYSLPKGACVKKYGEKGKYYKICCRKYDINQKEKDLGRIYDIKKGKEFHYIQSTQKSFCVPKSALTNKISLKKNEKVYLTYENYIAVKDKNNMFHYASIKKSELKKIIG